MSSEQGQRFVLDPKAFWGMCGPQFVVALPPADLYRRFGYPLLNDGDGESLGTYIFASPNGTVATIYFRTYDVWSFLLRLIKRRFWRGEKVAELTIAAESRAQAEEFCHWLLTIVSAEVRPWGSGPPLPTKNDV